MNYGATSVQEINTQEIPSIETIPTSLPSLPFTPSLSLPSSIMSVVMANSTLLAEPESYMAIYHELSQYNVHLNIFERLWAVSISAAPSSTDQTYTDHRHRAGTPTCRTMSLPPAS